MSELEAKSEVNTTASPAAPRRRGRKVIAFAAVVVVVAVASALVTALLVNIFQRKQEARNPYLKVVDVDENTTDPAVWGANWPREYDSYLQTVDTTRTRYGGSDAVPAQKLDRDPWLRRMYSGYAFSLDYRDRRGHAYMLFDQEQTERVAKKPQPGACLHCHASVIPTYRRIGAGGVDVSPSGPLDFDWPTVMKGFELVCAMKYSDAHAELLKTPDGSPGSPGAPTPSNTAGTSPTTRQAIAAHAGEAHPVSCVDCHDPANMALRVTRPAFVTGIRAYMAKQGVKDFDPNRDATRQQMRSYVCGQCHVEYYFKGDGKLVTYPWDNGLKVEEIEAYYDDLNYKDWTHGETGAPVLKAQHPEFELWNQGVHARSGVACADCHMPYTREGALKVSDHWVRSPLLNVSRACQVCHNYPEQELLDRAATIQNRTHDLMQRSAAALTDMLDAIKTAKANGATEQDLADAYKLQRRAQWRLDFISSENSMGFHADQETARVLGESIDFARQGQLAAQKLLMREGTKAGTGEGEPVRGVTPADKAPAGAPFAEPSGGVPQAPAKDKRE